MPSVTRRFHTHTPPDAVYEFLADFSNAELWDPGTVHCTRIDGDGGPGTRYRNVSSFLGRQVEVEYVAEELEPGRLVHFVGRNQQFTGHDRMDLTASGAGTEISYHAILGFHGLSKLAEPVVAAYLPLLAKKTIDQLRSTLDGLSGRS